MNNAGYNREAKVNRSFTTKSIVELLTNKSLDKISKGIGEEGFQCFFRINKLDAYSNLFYMIDNVGQNFKNKQFFATK